MLPRGSVNQFLVMRITNQTLTSRSLRVLSENLRLLSEAQERAATQKRLRQASDDPSAASEVMRIDSSLRAVERYRSNVDAVRGRVAAEEAVLDQLTSLLTRAEEIAVGQASATSNTATRAAARLEVDSLLRYAVSLGNTKFGDEYLFGGHFADAAPFDAEADLSQPPLRDLYVSEDPRNPGVKREPTGNASVAIAPGFTMEANHNGSEVFLDTGVLEALHALSHALEADDADAIRETIGTLQASFASLQEHYGSVGARSNQLDITESSILSLQANLKAHRSGLADAEFEEAVTELAARQSSYQAALLATSRVLNLSITDYLR